MATRLKPPIEADDELAMTIENAARQDDGAIASSHLAAGFPIYYSEADTPPDAIIKEYPGGRRELVSFDLQGEHRSEEHTSELQSLMRISYAVCCLNKKKTIRTNTNNKRK